MNAKIARYWRQVRAVQQMTGGTIANARRAVTRLRAERGYQTAAETKRHPRIVARVSGGRLVERREPSAQRGSTPRGRSSTRRTPITDLDDWIQEWGSWDGAYDDLDIETNVDY